MTQIDRLFGRYPWRDEETGQELLAARLDFAYERRDLPIAAFRSDPLASQPTDAVQRHANNSARIFLLEGTFCRSMGRRCAVNPLDRHTRRSAPNRSGSDR